MSQLFEWSPLIAFFVVFKLGGIYWATGALMLASVALLLAHRARTGRFKNMHLITAGVVLVLGGATLFLHDKRFIQWKPTVLFGVAALAFLGSAVGARRPLARRLLEGLFSEPLDVAPRTWVLINSTWTAWFALLAVLNIFIARHFTETVWVNFKVFGITAAMIAFIVPQVLWLHGRIVAAEPT